MRTAVDILFRTLAETHGSHSIAIILSGLDGDSSVGIKPIKEHGGLAVAQDPVEAEHRGMPHSAIETGMVDWMLPVAEIRADCSSTNRANGEFAYRRNIGLRLQGLKNGMMKKLSAKREAHGAVAAEQAKCAESEGEKRRICSRRSPICSVFSGRRKGSC
jgi:CheB methylesterase